MDIIAYQQSIAAEFEALKNRVRFFIGDAHHGEDGRYKEIILMNFIKSIVPDNVGVGTGFVKNSDGLLTRQIDILIYKKHMPTLFSQGDFVILMPESVLGIIEVKTRVTACALACEIIDKCEYNGRIIGNKDIFNGIWGYDSNTNYASDGLRERLQESNGYLNHICFGSNKFCRFWSDGNPADRHDDNRPCYSFYDLSWNTILHNGGNREKSGLAYGYFLSNLLEFIYRQVSSDVLSKQYFEFLYPIEGTKELYRIQQYEVKLDTN